MDTVVIGSLATVVISVIIVVFIAYKVIGLINSKEQDGTGSD